MLYLFELMNDVTSNTPSQSYPLDLEMLAAALRADTGDIATFFEVLAKKLIDILGERVTLEREGGIFHKEHKILRISVELGDTYLEIEKVQERVVCRQRHAVKGIVLKTAEVAFADWLTVLVGLLAEESRQNEATRKALEEILLK
ncbi:MAG: hypothetical protein M1483_04450 [Actinobacteria bacterium]|nr:hypothetical protein [Actinomycetota bacterium]MCL6104863.1 hypothetical protein [Actinomycetota bacterium]